jgi:DNA repair protein SbcD/Mre11
MAVRVLCTGDIHIGRSCSKVPDSYRCSKAWTTIVDLAISEDVDVLAISGDVVDKESKSYESIGPLQDGLRRLNEAGIDTVAIAGNHDHDVLPRVAGITGTDRFHVLGVGGFWERVTIKRDDEPCLHICGWSFPQEHVRENPMHGFVDVVNDGIPVLGLLHADIGNVRSHYAPVTIEELRARKVDFWLLGHIHVPRAFPGADECTGMYPGSPYAMDPGEPGVHGVWMVTFEPGRAIRPELIAISPVRYVTADINLTGIDDESAFQNRLTSELFSLATPGIDDRGATYLTAVSSRIRLTGSSSAHHAIPVWAEKARLGMTQFPVGSVTVFIEEIVSEVRPPGALDSLAEMNNPLGQTARLLFAMDSPVPEPIYADLIKRTINELTSVHEHHGYVALRTSAEAKTFESPSETDARNLLKSEGWRLLSTLLAQKEQS